MSQIINPFNFHWDQSGEQKHEVGRNLSFNFTFLCKISFVSQYLAKKFNSIPTFTDIQRSYITAIKRSWWPEGCSHSQFIARASSNYPICNLLKPSDFYHCNMAATAVFMPATLTMKSLIYPRRAWSLLNPRLLSGHIEYQHHRSGNPFYGAVLRICKSYCTPKFYVLAVRIKFGMSRFWDLCSDSIRCRPFPAVRINRAGPWFQRKLLGSIAMVKQLQRGFGWGTIEEDSRLILGWGYVWRWAVSGACL